MKPMRLLVLLLPLILGGNVIKAATVQAEALREQVLLNGDWPEGGKIPQYFGEVAIYDAFIRTSVRNQAIEVDYTLDNHSPSSRQVAEICASGPHTQNGPAVGNGECHLCVGKSGAGEESERILRKDL